MARDRIGLLLLACYGFRIGSRLKITIAQLAHLYEGRATEVQVAKSRKKLQQRLPATSLFKKWAKKLRHEFELVFANTPLDSPLFTCSREHLTRRLNTYFKKLGALEGTRYTSHSGRIGDRRNP